MLELTQRLYPESQGSQAIAAFDATLTLPLNERVRSRFRATLDDGTPIGVLLDRGKTLRDGDLIRDTHGFVVKICAAIEPLSVVHTDNPVLLARICYHLGNRHVAVQIHDGEVRYQCDHVLDDMLGAMGVRPVTRHETFEPEPGAYSGASHHATKAS